MLREEQKRAEAAHALLQNERNYCADLRTVRDVFVAPLQAAAARADSTGGGRVRDRSHAVFQSEVDAVFGHWAALLGLHEELLQRLETRVAGSGWNRYSQ